METNGKSVLRQRFCDYMALRGLSESTQEEYLRSVVGLVRYYRRSPDEFSNSEIQSYLLYLIRDRKLAWSSCNVVYAALRVFYRDVLGWDQTRFSIPPRVGRTLRPQVLSLQEVERLLHAAGSLRDRALLMTTYSAGLRVSEVVHLKPTDIESDRMLIRVQQAKGQKDRYTMLADGALKELRQYWKVYHPGQWMFVGSDRTKPISISAAQRIYGKTRAAAGISHGRGIHSLRHAFATHLLEAGVDLMTIRQWMGHNNLKTTAGYLQVATNRRVSVRSPLDTLSLSSPSPQAD
ncbi:MAG: site-specific integrase, partial [Candidatus Latescibacterota bacterium]